jgi:protein-S-isoprenylcysteine O-methyltransferase Ste14
MSEENPRRPTLALVTSGPFRYSRNPLYSAMLLLVYLGVSTYCAATWPLALLVPMLIVLQWGVIAREESSLTAKFAAACQDSRARVRRWF